jgi:hypothetical protein
MFAPTPGAMEEKMIRITTLVAAVAILFGAGSSAALADACSGHSHDTGTILGGAGGALIGGLASHNATGAVVGGVGGALAGNAIARAQDCKHRTRRTSYYIDREGHRHYYTR